ncbi:hypothetical protein SAMN05216228_104141 [Rhizobium tibeticum]|uniref:Uncharacterized protein n=1 Tax=Rhizobium tibeticum TaxID=501024 RepID=A0A1H8VCU3_9HYPH|nr:hypothetical protein RTCCBAU85039_5969 [Rhizobium tibeticum]SEP13300.1 hypothetical protein SAMN05216228_104141 [Rhizobium tibeticum]
MQQLGLFDTLRRPAVRVPAVVDEPVLQTETNFIFKLKHPRDVWDRARIEIHQHTDWLWMRSTSWMTAPAPAIGSARSRGGSLRPARTPISTQCTKSNSV